MTDATVDWVQEATAISQSQPVPHGGAGTTIAAPFFEHEPGLELVVRQRTLPKGASIGAHLHDKDEIYYVVSGEGSYRLDDESQRVAAGHAMLVRSGHTHALQQTGERPLVILVVYRQRVAAAQVPAPAGSNAAGPPR